MADSAGGSARCVCGHDRQSHQHYRAGSECALCSCSRWRRASWLRRLRGKPSPAAPGGA